MWFDSWSDLVRVLLVGGSAYATLVLVLRVAGKRTLAKLNAFDLVVTVALGSTLATILLNNSITWAEGATALLLLAALQWVVAVVASRWPSSRTFVTASPSALLLDGRLDGTELARQRVSRSEVLQAVRSSGHGDLADMAAVILETDGTISVISRSQLGEGTSLADVPGAENEKAA